MADVDVQLGSVIKALRTAHKISQTELGQRIGVTFQQVQKYERGANRVSAATLMLIARALGVSAADILQACEGPSDGAGTPVFLSDPLERDLVAGFRGVASLGRRQAIVGLVREMAEAGL